MTDPALLAKRQAMIETSVQELRSLGRPDAFRDILVHGYDDVDLRVVEDIVRSRLDDLLAFVSAVRARAGAL